MPSDRCLFRYKIAKSNAQAFKDLLALSDEDLVAQCPSGLEAFDSELSSKLRQRLAKIAREIHSPVQEGYAEGYAEGLAQGRAEKDEDTAYAAGFHQAALLLSKYEKSKDKDEVIEQMEGRGQALYNILGKYSQVSDFPELFRNCNRPDHPHFLNIGAMFHPAHPFRRCIAKFWAVANEEEKKKKEEEKKEEEK
ncbi:hypothetical protein NX059_001860 [Plenodomus lindquistii]|nr:hypothetical protein NX059_001860 [Plenodomus lindquistii]